MEARKYNLRDRESIKILKRYEASVTISDEPMTYTEAITEENADKWKLADNWKSRKRQSIKPHKKITWTLVSLPKDHDLIGCK